MEHFAFDVSQVDGRAVVVARGEIDMLAAPPLLRLVDELSDREDRVVIDLRKAEFIDSSGFSALVRAHRRLGDRLTLVRPTGRVARALTATGLDQLVPFADAP